MARTLWGRSIRKLFTHLPSGCVSESVRAVGVLPLAKSSTPLMPRRWRPSCRRSTIPPRGPGRS